ncbi:MAG: rod shape-determining protein RodA [Dehalococcoidia bacterium]|nr:rod shape-determining protein RodA [Dehalococcoidia bacterium]
MIASFRAHEFRNYDYLLMAWALGLVAVGLAILYSASTSETNSPTATLTDAIGRQILFLVLGVGASLGLARLDYRVLGNYWLVLYSMAVFGLIAVLIIGVEIAGATRWISLPGGFLLQPSEFAKVLGTVALAKYLSQREARLHEPQVFLGSLAIIAPLMALVFVEPDLGTTIVFAVIWLAMLIMAGASSRHLLIMGGVILALIPFALIIAVSDYQEERLATFLDPNKDRFGAGYNVIQAEISVGSGGLMGQGFLNGSQSQLGFLQVRSSDFIFSVFGEEFGFVGSLFLLTLFGAFILRALRVAQEARDPFGRLLATGFAIMILGQVFINIGVNIRLLPVTGIPLPFISQGGSSLISIFMGIGVLQSIIMRQRQSY